jgi:hypothetical protein
MTDMTADEPYQADLLDIFWAALAHDVDTTPPVPLDPGLAMVAWCLVRDLPGPEPDATHAAHLRHRLAVEAAGLYAQRNGAGARASAPAPRPDTEAGRERG